MTIFAIKSFLMKSFLSIVFLAFSLVGFSQEGIKFQESSFKEILALAKKENKLVFLDAYASWCGPCKMMERNVFTKPLVSDYFNSKFINSHFDMEKGEGREIAQKYQIYSYPTLLFLNGDGEVVSKSIGYQDDTQLISLGESANNIYGNGGSLKERFEAGESDPEFLLGLIKLNLNADTDLARRASERYFSVKKNKEFTQEEVYMLFNFIPSLESPNYEVFKDNQVEITKQIPADVYTQFDNQLKLNHLIPNSINKDTQEINEAYFLTEAEKITGSKEEAQNFLHILELNFYPNVGNFKAYEKAALKAYGDGENQNATELAKAAYIFSENINTPSSLKTATVWAEKSVMAGETSDNTYVLAKLYYKTGNTEGAKLFAESSKDLALKNGSDTTKIDKLLKEINK